MVVHVHSPVVCIWAYLDASSESIKWKALNITEEGLYLLEDLLEELYHIISPDQVGTPFYSRPAEPTDRDRPSIMKKFADIDIYTENDRMIHMSETMLDFIHIVHREHG